jgi:hypothetical protein
MRLNPTTGVIQTGRKRVKQDTTRWLPGSYPAKSGQIRPNPAIDLSPVLELLSEILNELKKLNKIPVSMLESSKGITAPQPARSIEIDETVMDVGMEETSTLVKGSQQQLSQEETAVDPGLSSQRDKLRKRLRK